MLCVVCCVLCVVCCVCVWCVVCVVCVVWCGVVWCGVVWCGVVWCGVVWCGVVWCGVVWCVWCGVVWCGVVWCGVVWCGVVWCGVVWCGVVCVVLMIKTRGSLSCQAPEMQLIRVAEHLGASSRRPRHPFPALMAGEPPPLAVYLCTRPKKATRQRASACPEQCQLRDPTETALSWTSQGTCVARQRACQLLVEELQPWNLDGLLNSKTMETCLCAATGM